MILENLGGGWDLNIYVIQELLWYGIPNIHVILSSKVMVDIKGELGSNLHVLECIGQVELGCLISQM